jgi:hypothetical protein
MTHSQQKILDAMCSHRLFSIGDRYARILRYLAKHSFPNSAENRKKRTAIAIWGHFYEATTASETNVRRDLGILRERAAKYAEISGYEEALLILGRGNAESNQEINRVTFVKNLREQNLGKFWAPYLNRKSPASIVYTEPLFFHDIKQRLWARDLSINDDREAHRFALRDQGDFSPARNYIPVGEFRAILGLTEWFARHKVTVDPKAFHHAEYDDIPKVNLILLGPPRCNPIMSLLQRRFHYQMQDSSISVKSPARTELNRFQDSIADENIGDYEGAQAIHVLVTRLPHPADRSLTVTSIASDHTRAILRVCEVLTNETELASLIQKPDLRSYDTFQMIFKTEVFGGDALARSVELIETWPDNLLIPDE